MTSQPRRPNGRLWLVWLLLLIAFIGLGIRASTGSVLAIDVSIAKDVQALPPLIGRFFDFENWLGETTPLAVVTFAVAFVLLLRPLRAEAALMIAGFLPLMGDVVVKHLVDEPRPSSELVRVNYPHDKLSFLSGHVIGITIVFVLVWLFAPALFSRPMLRRVVQVSCTLLVLTIWLARVWAGAHWPSDTVGGYLYAGLFLIPSAAWYHNRRASA